MIKTKWYLSLFFVFVLSSPSHAFDFHIGAGGGSYQVDDPAMGTEPAFAGFVLAGISHPLGRNSRLVTDLQYTQFATESGANKMGMDANVIDWSFSYAYQYPFTYEFRPTFSAGMFANYLSLTKRHSVDPDGWLKAQFEDHDAVTAGAVLSAQHSFTIDRFDSEWALGLQFKQAFDGVSSFGAFALYRF